MRRSLFFDCTMPIPALDDHGLLPKGIFDCHWQDIQNKFCWNAHRQQLFDGAQQFLQSEWQPLRLEAQWWVDGSFTRNKEFPEDVDLVADISHLSLQAAFPAFLLWFQQERWKRLYAVDFWIKHPSLPNDLTHFFQYVGLKAGAELSLDTRFIKGILRIQ